MIACPVALLPSLGLETWVGLSAEDPMGRVTLQCPMDLRWTTFQPNHRPLHHSELPMLEPKEQRWVHLSALVQPTSDQLVLISRTPCVVHHARLDETMWRTVVRYQPTGKPFYGDVIYELPPNMNASPGSTTLTQTAVLVGKEHRAWLVLMHYSVNPEWSAVYNLQQPFRASRVLATNSVAVIPLEGDGLLSVVGLCTDAAIMVLVLQQHVPTGMVTVEHTHPAQSCTLTKDDRQRKAIKQGAIRAWH